MNHSSFIYPSCLFVFALMWPLNYIFILPNTCLIVCTILKRTIICLCFASCFSFSFCVVNSSWYCYFFSFDSFRVRKLYCVQLFIHSCSLFLFTIHHFVFMCRLCQLFIFRCLLKHFIHCAVFCIDSGRRQYCVVASVLCIICCIISCVCEQILFV